MNVYDVTPKTCLVPDCTTTTDGQFELEVEDLFATIEIKDEDQAKITAMIAEALVEGNTEADITAAGDSRRLNASEEL